MTPLWRQCKGPDDITVMPSWLHSGDAEEAFYGASVCLIASLSWADATGQPWTQVKDDPYRPGPDCGVIMTEPSTMERTAR